MLCPRIFLYRRAGYCNWCFSTAVAPKNKPSVNPDRALIGGASKLESCYGDIQGRFLLGRWQTSYSDSISSELWGIGAQSVPAKWLTWPVATMERTQIQSYRTQF